MRVLTFFLEVLLNEIRARREEVSFESINDPGKIDLQTRVGILDDWSNIIKNMLKVIKKG